MATDFGKGNRAIAFNPTSAVPLDARTYFESYSEALAKAQTAEEVGSTDSQYHYGMKLLVNDNEVYTWYKIVKGEPYLEAEGTGGGSSGGNGEGEYDGDAGYIDYTTVWRINDAPVVTGSGVSVDIYATFISNGEEFVRINNAVLSLKYYRTDGTFVEVWTNRNGWNNIEYKDITIQDEITDDILFTWLDTNAFILSGSREGNIIRDPDRTANLPTIRFVGLSTDTGSFYAPDEWYFTVEIVGNGRLRLGDYLELCAMRTCKRPQGDKNAGYKRQRLRKLNQQVIRDTSKKFLTLVVSSDNERQLFKNDRNAVSTGGCRSTIYLRLKRPFIDENGCENYAKFSNVIRLQQSYDLSERHLSIK